MDPSRADQFYFNYGLNIVPRNIAIAGHGTWPGTNLVRVGFFNVATNLLLANDVTANWNQLSIYGGSTIQTGAFTLTMPCSSTFDPSSSQYINGEIIGTVRRTNLGDCGGTAVQFTSRFTSVRFDSGTPPSEMTISNTLAAPPGFPSAVRRDYRITPVGGSGYSATLRLDYSPAETNGNPINTLALWRNNGTNWIAQGATFRDLSAHWVELSGVSEFSPWALASCALSISPGGTSIAAGGGMSSFQVTSTGTCGWTATSNAPWITVKSGASGSGNETVAFTAAANTGAQRNGIITVAGAGGTTENFSVSQDEACLGITLNPTSANVPAFNAFGSIAVTASGCSWAATSNEPWITITSGASGSGSGTVGYTVQNNSGPERSGTISVSDETFTVTQESGCNFYFTPTEQGVSGAGGTNTFDIFTGAACSWSVANDIPWITIVSGTSGTGDATVSYEAAANPGPPRTGTMTINGETFRVNQGGATPLALMVTSTNDSGPGSLRQALLESNANFGQTNTISFNLTGSVTIALQTGLPYISVPIVLNGTNSDGRSVILQGAGSGEDLIPDGGGGGAFYGLVSAAENITIRGLTMVRFPYAALIFYAERTVIEHCFLGTDELGSPGLGNGVAISAYSSNNRVGGVTPGTGNVIARNTDIGLYASSPNNVIQGNYIGTNAAGANLGNLGPGVQIDADDNAIGGTNPAAANVIAYNGGAGITIGYAMRNAIRGNSIFENGGLGIFLSQSGGGKPGQAPAPKGPVGFQQFPVLSATPGANAVQGVIEAAPPNSTVAIEFFSNEACDPSGYGEGRTFLGSINAATDSNGHGSFTFDLPGSVTPGNFITATATDAVGNTSEFSACVQVTPALQLVTAVSRKTHGSAGTFDIPLPLSGAPGVECRSSGGGHTLVVTMNHEIVSGNAAITDGSGSVSGSPTFIGNTMTVNLTGVADVQKITVTLSNVTDSSRTSPAQHRREHERPRWRHQREQDRQRHRYWTDQSAIRRCGYIRQLPSGRHSQWHNQWQRYRLGEITLRAIRAVGG